MKRVWIYQSNRFLQPDEVCRAEEILQEFVVQWTAHGNQLAGSFEIRYCLFIFLMVDEAQAMVTGCSVDKSVHLLKKIEQELGITLFDRLQIAYRKSKGEDIQVVSQDQFRSLLADARLDTDQVIVFNNMIDRADELSSRWEVPLKESWHAKVYL